MILRGASSSSYFSSPLWSSPTSFCPTWRIFCRWRRHCCTPPPPLCCCRCRRPNPRGLPSWVPPQPRPCTYSFFSWSDLRNTRRPLSMTKLKVQSKWVIKSQSPCSHIIVAMAASGQKPFSPSCRPLAVTVTLGHLIDHHPWQILTPFPSDRLEAILVRRSESPHLISSAALLISPTPADLLLSADYIPPSPPLLLS